jgi:hypothetical protein
MPHTFYDGPGLLTGIQVTAALGTADAMIEWRFFDLEAQIYGAPEGRPGPGTAGSRARNRSDPDVIHAYPKA